MKTSILLLAAAPLAESFLVAPPNQRSLTLQMAKSNNDGHPILSKMVQGLDSVLEDLVEEKDDTRMVKDLDEAHHEWAEEAKRIHQVEHSLESDAYLAGLVEPSKEAQKAFIDKEAHRHDSLFAEVAHAIENDPDLANIVAEKDDKVVNPSFMEQEAHVHDSLLNEIAHSLDNDPDLTDLYSM
ncbi:expressed unknown protein [Seminavis robusta]|uniref:Uncharacterized protein n=1 Tax=Seminavis robusta TaxID=568900 RepID=A0A9N8HLV3_9STRA|nr:expressed unknown protein [Seminavis robusta]|eukprot:Sro855_g211450.1 n/a (183) ;mRNA; r:34987-35535